MADDARIQAAAYAISVEGMSCASCVAHVEKALAQVPGVASVGVNLATEQARVVLSDPAALAKLAPAIEAAGYSVRTATAEFAVSDMNCASCVTHVEAAARRVPGVIEAVVNLATERAHVVYRDGIADPPTIVRAISDAGYAAMALGSEATPHARVDENAALARRLVLAAVLGAPVFAVEMGGHVFPPLHGWIHAALPPAFVAYASLALTTLVMFGPGLGFQRVGLANLRRGTPDMNTLVAVGTLSAYLYSLAAVVAPDRMPDGAAHLYFEAAVSVVVLVLLGRYLEGLSRGHARDAIARLGRLQAKTARVERDGAFVELPIAAVAVGDRLQVRPGERIAADGMLASGHSYIDESMVTGEPVPVFKEAGAAVIGGTVNQNGSFVFAATKVGADTMLAQIQRLVENAQAGKLPIQAVVDRVTARFVPAVFAAAAATFACWMLWGGPDAFGHALANAVAVLIVACPCAMGLATPISILVASGRAAERGILFRRGEALQRLGTVTLAAFDKTGTLTKGRPELADLVAAPGFAADEVLALLAALEASSEHPIAAAIVRAAQDKGLAAIPVADFAATPGLGARARVGGREVAVGADRYLASLGISVAPFADAMAEFAKAGKSPIFAAIDGRLAALAAVADPIRPSAKAAIASLHAAGLATAMVSGDNSATAENVAQTLGISRVVAEAMPADKLAALARWRAEGATIAFVGDGINDAPALAQADIGIAVGSGTDIAIDSADVVLVAGDLAAVAEAVALSKATMRNIRQNLFWAFGYNVALLPVAAGALYPWFGIQMSPIFAAAAMAASSVFVVGNALRLRRFGKRPRS
jgi:Cu+-exporting ATPase